MFKVLASIFFLLFLLIEPPPVAAEGLPSVGLCPVLPAAVAKLVAAEVKGGGTCSAYCQGCGCKGGPGYRGPPGYKATAGGCVSYADLVRVCGEPPHERCQPECAQVVAGCSRLIRGYDWLKSIAETAGIRLSFVQGTHSLGKPKEASLAPK